MRLPAALLAVAALALASVAAAEPVVETKTTPVGLFLERDIPLTKGERVVWNVTLAPPEAKASWDIHYHDDANRPRNVQQGTMQGGYRGTFAAPAEDTYSFFVVNSYHREPINITLATEVLPPAAPSPDGGAAVAAAGVALAAVLLAARRR